MSTSVRPYAMAAPWPVAIGDGGALSVGLLASIVGFAFGVAAASVRHDVGGPDHVVRVDQLQPCDAR